MENEINATWILSLKDKFIKIGWANGIGPKSGWITKFFRWILKITIHKPHSEYRDAGIVHDVLYAIGGNEKDRLRSDNIFLNVMFKIWTSKLFSWSIIKEIAYFFIALGYYFVVRVKGKNHFTYRDASLTKQEVLGIVDK